ncbi:alpha-amylase [Mucilaginibacter ginkgonis]|uniref:Alpha-amylase n=2 Tax=Mucilaginibacter ginkgonis TaxID=2682091 RepID=A0A6I4I135_9SPHI|nr:alpha-amylase [Mucilaginibacter ginkgonis]
MSSTPNDKLTIYQLMPRLFGNKNTTNKFYGSIEENGCGKFNDINETALTELKKLGITHVWYTGVVSHATMTDYSAYGIPVDDPDVVKGRAGSPYAVKDYYDVDPDLAVDVKKRMDEYQSLIERTHKTGLKVLMDFVPNHVARTYHSPAAGKQSFGVADDKTKAFDPKNDFYYIPGKPFVAPQGYNSGGANFNSPLKDGNFDENPAKATGNDVFSASPSIDDWFETIKLNYGIDYSTHKTFFDPIPPVWQKMFDILNFWSKQGVDGFRCDMVENVPTEFWGWVIGKLKETHPDLIFIGEAYDKSKYNNYLTNGKFNYLYDKSGLYDSIKKLTRHEDSGTIWDINGVWNYDTKGIGSHMVRFMENHDEQRVASPFFAGNVWYAIPGMIITATLSTGPVMIYFGQEVGEPGMGTEGFSAEDGRTSIFDYWGVPQHQKWVNGGKYDGGALSDEQKSLRNFYSKLLNAVKDNEALSRGEFYELMLANGKSPGVDTHTYIYLRYTANKRVLIITNFNREERNMNVQLTPDLIRLLKLNGVVKFTDLLHGASYSTADITKGLDITLPATSGVMLEF